MSQTPMRPNRLVDGDEETWDAYLWIDDADALYKEFQQKGVKITRAKSAIRIMAILILKLRIATATVFASDTISKPKMLRPVPCFL